MNFSTYNYDRTVDYEEYVNIQNRSAAVVDFLWEGLEWFVGKLLPAKPSEIIEFLCPEKENPPQRWDIYLYRDGYEQYSNLTVIPSNIPTVMINSLDIGGPEINASWTGIDKDTYEGLIFLPDNRDLTRYLDGNSTSDLTYSYRITQGGNVYEGHSWTAYNSEASMEINISRSGNYTLELRVKDEVDNIGMTTVDFSIAGEEPEEPEPEPEPVVEGRILYTCRWSSANRDIYIMNQDGTNQTILTDSSFPSYISSKNQSPSWSFDRKKIIFISNKNRISQIYTMNPDGTEQRTWGESPIYGYYPAESPDGKKIAYYQDGKIWIRNLDGSSYLELTEGVGSGRSPSWSPDGNQIVFDSNGEEDASSGQDYEIYIINIDGTNLIRLTNNNSGDYSPTWSPKGTKILFESNRDGNYEIYIMDADGSNQINLTNNRSTDRGPTWSPDGTKIAFASWRIGDGNREIYVMNTDGSNQTNITNNGTDDYDPSWY